VVKEIACSSQTLTLEDVHLLDGQAQFFEQKLQIQALSLA